MAEANSGHDDDVVDESKVITELYNPRCCLKESVKEDSDRFLKATDLDSKKMDLLKTYLDFNRDLWPRAISNPKISHTEQIILDKLKEFQDAVKEYGMKDIFEKHCFLYREFEINGVARKVKKRKKLVDIKSAFTDTITFPNYVVSLKTTNSKPDKKDARSEITTKSWKEATQDYLDRYYPTDGVFRIPPSLEYEDQLKMKTSKKPLVKDVLQLGPDDEAVENRIPYNIKVKYENTVKGFFDKRRSVKAESEILIAFEKWGRDTKQNMFIFGGYDYSNYLNNVADLKSITTEQGEFDVLIISEQLGVILVEVKGSVGAKYLTIKSGVLHQTDTKAHGDNGVAKVSDKIEKETDRRSNVANPKGRQCNDRCSPPNNDHCHRTSKSDVGHTNVDNVCNPTDVRMRSGQEKSTSLRTSSNGLSSQKLPRDVIPNDVSQCELSGEKDFVNYKETTSRSIQSEIQDGWKQLMKGNFVFREMNRDLGFVKRLPFKAFVGLPFLSLSDLNDAGICSHHQKYLIFSEDLNRLRDWLLENHFPEGYEKQAMSREEFRELAARFAGLASAVTTEIDTIKFTNRKMMCTFLTPEQTAILQNKQKHAVLFGDYGTGKTLVLTRKATSLLSSPDKPSSKSEKKQEVLPTGSNVNVVHIIPCADLSNFKSCYEVTFSNQFRGIEKFVGFNGNGNSYIYKSFLDFYLKVTGSPPDRNVEVGIEMVIQAVDKALHYVGERDVAENEQPTISQPMFVTKKEKETNSKLQGDNTSQTFIERVHGEKVQKEEVVHHFFFDEFPVQLLKDGALNRLREFFLETEDSLKDSHLWINVATHSLGVSSGKNPANVLKKELSIENKKDILFCYLEGVMRVSEGIYNMIKEIETFIDKGHFRYSGLGHMLKGIKPRLFKLPERKCENLEKNALGCECQVANLATTLGGILDAAVGKDGQNLEVMIMIYYVMSTSMFRRLRALLTRVAQLLDIVLIWNTMQSRYTEEISAFADGLNRGVDSLSKGVDALQTSPTMMDGKGLREGVKAFRSPSPAAGSKTSEVKKLSTKWKIQVVDQRTFAGCEAPVLIFIDPFGMRHWFKRGDGKGSGYHSLIFTRCTGHFILITWPDNEARKMWNQHLNEYEAEIKESDASERYKQGRYEYINTGRFATENCLQMLLDKDLINQMTNEED